MTSPVELTGNGHTSKVTLYCADCLEVLPTLSGIEAVVTDPPYGIGYQPSGGNGVAQRGNLEVVSGDDKPFEPEPILALKLPSILWGANHYANRLPPKDSWLVWWKKQGVSGCEFADCEMAWSSVGGVARLFNHRWHGMIRDSEIGQTRVHATQKPIALMEWCLTFLPESKTVLDPYMGSGTTGVACVRTGRNFIGIEKEPKYFDIAVERIKRELDQGKLL